MLKMKNATTNTIHKNKRWLFFFILIHRTDYPTQTYILSKIKDTNINHATFMCGIMLVSCCVDDVPPMHKEACFWSKDEQFTTAHERV